MKKSTRKRWNPLLQAGHQEWDFKKLGVFFLGTEVAGKKTLSLAIRNEISRNWEYSSWAWKWQEKKHCHWASEFWGNSGEFWGNSGEILANSGEIQRNSGEIQGNSGKSYQNLFTSFHSFSFVFPGVLGKSNSPDFSSGYRENWWKFRGNKVKGNSPGNVNLLSLSYHSPPPPPRPVSIAQYWASSRSIKISMFFSHPLCQCLCTQHMQVKTSWAETNLPNYT